MTLYLGSLALYAAILLSQWVAFCTWAVALTVRGRAWNRETSRTMVLVTGLAGSGAAVMFVLATLAADAEHLLPSGWMVLLGMLIGLGTVPWVQGIGVAFMIRVATCGAPHESHEQASG